MYDLIIIGAGPSGITAAVYAARQSMNFMLITGDIGGQAAVSYDIENYTGYQFVKGPELVEKFSNHLKQFDIDLREAEQVTSIEPGAVIKVKTAKEEFETRTVIIATGRKPRLLNVPGEEKLRNRGVTYCATCDGPLFRGKDVAVIGGGNAAMGATLQLMSIVNRIYLVNINPELSGDAILKKKIMESEKVTVYNNTVTVGIRGDKFVSGIETRTADKKGALEVQGIFVEIGSVPVSDFAPNLQKTDMGEIIINCKNETSEQGIFAAGDVTNVPEKQIIIAAGEGAKACLGAFRYLAKKEII